MLKTPGLDQSNTIENLVDALADTLDWEWDERFGGVLAAFEVTAKDRVFNVVNKQLGEGWDTATLGKAPRDIRNTTKDFGGLAPGQLLFSQSLTENISLLGLWCPWGNRTTISIRFVPSGPANSDREVDAARAALKVAFGL